MTLPLHADHAQVQAYLRREPAAVAWLAERLTAIPRIVQYLGRRNGAWSQGDLSDIAQESGLVALRRLDSYHGLVPVEAWLHRICVLTMHSQARSRRLRLTAQLDGDTASATPSPAQQVADNEQWQAVLQAIDAIGGAEADMLRQRYIDGLDFSDIATRAGIPLATARTRFYRGFQKLKDRIAPTTDGTEDSPR